MRRLFARHIFLTLVSMSVLLTGCGSTGVTSGGSSSTTTSSTSKGSIEFHGRGSDSRVAASIDSGCSVVNGVTR